jgi:hypothetical protein
MAKKIADNKITKAVENAYNSANEEGDNWADAVDIALEGLGLDVDTSATAEEDANGYGPVAVLTDGRRIWRDEQTKKFSIE